MVNGDARNSNNGSTGPGSVPSMHQQQPSPQLGQQGQQNQPMNQHQAQQQMNQQPRPNYPGNQGVPNDADLSELLSPVSESSNVAHHGMYEDQMSRVPMSPFQPSSSGANMMGAPPQMRPQNAPRRSMGMGPPMGGMGYPMPPHQQGPPYMRHPMPPHGFPPGHPMHPGAHHHMMPGGGPSPMGTSGGKVYPPDQPMVFNPANPNAPPIYPCGVCHKEIHDSDQAILCESGCNFWFHRTCTGLTDMAYLLLTKEVYAEWVCDKCLSSGNIPLVKMKS